MNPHARLRKEQAERLPIRVHDIIISGNSRTKDAVIESEVEELLRGATTFQELRNAAAVAEERLRALDIFESVNVRADAGPAELPGTANVVVEVSEPGNPLVGKLRSFAKSAGDIWDALGHGLGVPLPRFKAHRRPWSAGINLLSEDWLRFPANKEGGLGFSLGILSSGNHDLFYDLSWRSLPDPPQLAYNALSAWKSTFEIDKRDSAWRPTRGFGCFSSTTIGGLFQDSTLWPTLIGGLLHDSRLWPTRFGFLSPTLMAGLFPDSWSLHFIHQEVALYHAIPLGFCGAALDLGVSSNVLFRFSVHGFRGFGLGPAEPREVVGDNMNNDRNFGIAYLDGDISLGAFADLSFDLPLKVLRDAGTFGHVLATTNCSSELTRNAYREFSLQNLRDSFQHSVKVGVVIPTSHFNMEVNYCYGFASAHDQGKTGIELTLASPK